MSDTSRYRGARAISTVLDKLGWLAALTGLALALYAAMFALGDDLMGRLSAGLPGLTLTLVGLISVCVAQLTRAATDAAIAMREVALLTRARGAAVASTAPPRDEEVQAPTRPKTLPPVSTDEPMFTLNAAIRAASGARRDTAPADPAPERRALTAARPERPAKVHPIFSARPPRQTS